ncbi:MAG TPA: SIS domain-containing protein [Candidatus Acidoferrum sp.]|nr:SIS domain-containing protein [Candidatus Acidoferrum sp.]
MTGAPVENVDERAIAVMRREIATIPAVIADTVRDIRPAMADLARRYGRDLVDLVVTGCGDSQFAGLATRLAFERDAGVRCRATGALELVRYDIRYLPTDPAPLLIAVSYSGEVGRTIEAATVARDFGWRSVALTGKPDGRLARAADEAILMRVPTLGFSPGTSTYVAMVTALLVLAAELARVLGRVDAAARLDEGLARAPDLAAETIAASEVSARHAAELMASANVTTFLGAGPSKATAAFGAAKLFEGPQRYGVVQDLEEWAHEQYFVSGPGTPVVIVAPAGASRDRADELLAEMAFIGAPTVVVGGAAGGRSEGSTPTGPHGIGPIELPIAAGLDEALSPLLTCLPLALAAFFLSERLGTRSYGFPSAEHEREHYETIHRATRGEPA